MKERSDDSIRLRCMWGALIFLSLLIFPWYVSLTILVTHVVLYAWPEVILYGFLLDLFWSPKSPWYMRFTFLGLSIILFLLSRRIRKSLRLEKN
jgi:hypothetical protein